MKLIKIFIFLLISITVSIKANSNEQLKNSLKEGGKLIFIRHAYAPGMGDPKNFDVKDCSTQRNLNQQGIEQSKKIGLFFDQNNIKIDKVISSEWCRCKDTAFFAFKKFVTKSFLNSFYDSRFVKNKDKQINEFKEYIIKIKESENIIFLTHYVNIFELLGVNTSSGEVIVTDKNLALLGRIEFDY
jgi:phosphohistidine phosphatase SixA